MTEDLPVSEPPPDPVPARAGRRRIYVIAGLPVLLAVVALVVWLVVSPTGTPARHVVQGPFPLQGHYICGAQVTLNVQTDQRMAAIAHTLLTDPKVETVYTLTKAQAYQQYQQEFADLPQLEALGRPQALPASVVIVPVSGADVQQLAAAYRTEFPDATESNVNSAGQSSVEIASGNAAGTTEMPPPCPH